MSDESPSNATASLTPILASAPPPPFQATPDQQEALDLMSSWLVSRSTPFFLLQGYAGTGKSFSITELAKSGPLKPSEICFTAPTNKAVKVLRNYLDGAGLQACSSKTIYSLLGLSLQANGEVKEISKPEEPVDLSGFKLIVVDEASMVNRFLMEAIEEAYSEWSVPFLFMGDPAQLPPVGEISSPVFKLENSFTLTKVLRYGNSMLDLATAIRNVVDSPFPTVKVTTNPPVYRVMKPEWMNKIEENLELIKSGDAKIIAWRNVKVDEYNSYVRRLIFGRDQARERWLPSDKIVATAHLKDLEGNTFMKTDEEAEIIQIAIGQHPLWPDFEIFNLSCKLENEARKTIRVLTEDGRFHVNNRLNELSMEAKAGKKYKWKEFWELKEAFHEIKHSYAITSHRSQGSSYIKTFVDLEDIMLNRNRPEAFRSLYVACTRQREEIWIS